MPIYEFNCTKCKKDFEILVMSSSESINCPHCNSRKVERLLSGFSRAGQGGEDSWDDYGAGADSYGGMGGGGGGGGCAGCAGGSCASCH